MFLSSFSINLFKYTNTYTRTQTLLYVLTDHRTNGLIISINRETPSQSHVKKQVKTRQI